MKKVLDGVKKMPGLDMKKIVREASKEYDEEQKAKKKLKKSNKEDKKE